MVCAVGVCGGRRLQLVAGLRGSGSQTAKAIPCSQSTPSLRIKGAAIAAVDAQEPIPRERPSKNLDEHLRVDSCLTKHTSQCPHCQITAMEQMPSSEAT